MGPAAAAEPSGDAAADAGAEAGAEAAVDSTGAEDALGVVPLPVQAANRMAAVPARAMSRPLDLIFKVWFLLYVCSLTDGTEPGGGGRPVRTRPIADLAW